MKFKKCFYLLCIPIFFFMCGSFSIAMAQDNGFTEAFDDPKLIGWDHSSNAVVINGVLHIESSGYAHHPGSWEDFSYLLKMQRFGTGQIVVSFQTSKNSGYHLLIDKSWIVLQRESEGVVRPLSENNNIQIPENKWIELEINSIQGEHHISINNEPIIQVEDQSPLPAGGIGFEVLDNAEANFDDLTLDSVESLSIPQKPQEKAATKAYESLPWVATGGPIGGLGYDIRYKFNDPDIWYVTDAWAGFHISTDNGYTWFPNNEGIGAIKALDGIPVFSATVDPHNPDILWAGTQDTGGVYKSIDGGYIWLDMSNGISKNLAPLTFRGFTIDPRTSDIVYAMAEIGSAGWTSDRRRITGIEMDKTMGIVYKTIDGGKNWKEIWRGDNLTRYCWIDPRDPDVLYISTGIFDREARNTDVEAGESGGVGILKSTDAGETWQVINEENGLLDLFVGSLYMHPENPDVLLAAASQNNWSYFDDRSTAGVYLSENGGKSWKRVIKDETYKGGGYGELFSSVEYCDSDPEIAYAASNWAIYRSIDGGFSWQSFRRDDGIWGPEGIIPGFPIDMQCDPRDPMRIFINNYLGGNFLSEDGGETWVTASSGYSGAQIRAVAVDPDQPWSVYAGGWTGIFRSDRGGQGEWTGLSKILRQKKFVFELNLISSIALNPKDPSTIFTGIGFGPVLIKSSNMGNSWETAAFSDDIEMMGITDINFAPSDPSVVYLSATPSICVEQALQDLDPLECERKGVGIYVSLDGGTTWTYTDRDRSVGKGIITLAVHSLDSNTVLAATYPDGIVKTTDGGENWIEIKNGLPSIAVREIAYDPMNPDIVFAGVMKGGLYRSENGGKTWTHSSAGMEPNSYITSIVIDPVDTQHVYAGDSLSGVYHSADGGKTWELINEGLDHKSVNSLTISSDGSVIYAGIEGAGVYRLGKPAGEPPKDQLQPQDGVQSDASVEKAMLDEERNAPQKSGRIPCLGSGLPTLLVMLGYVFRKRKRR